MLMSWVWTGIAGVSIFCALLTEKGADLAAAPLEGAAAAVTLTLGMAGSLCLWSGIGAVMEAAGITGMLSKLFSPVLGRLFPSIRRDSELSHALSGNFCANLLGLGNAATPMGIQAVQRLKQGSTATDELCRLIVLNTASIQLIPTNVAAVRSALGCTAPFDILPAVWLTSFCSAALGIAAAWVLGKLCRP